MSEQQITREDMLSSDTYQNHVFEDLLNYMSFRSGKGYFNSALQAVMSGIDKFGVNPAPGRAIKRGFTFITCPTICLESTNIQADRVMQTLDSTDPLSVSFAIRCLLDTNFRKKNSAIAGMSPLVNLRSPFMHPVMNCLNGISGYPAFNVETYTTEGGFHEEDQTFVIGSDFNSRTVELNLEFKDVSGGVILSIMYYWLTAMARIMQGRMINYYDDINQRRMPYTVSIYRFVTDPTMTHIEEWSKATGCFPKSVPLGAIMDINPNEIFISSASKFSIPFVANKVEYNDYAILMDFQRLVKNFCPNVATLPVLDLTSENNFSGIPYLETVNKEMTMEFRSDAAENLQYDLMMETQFI